MRARDLRLMDKVDDLAPGSINVMPFCVCGNKKLAKRQWCECCWDEIPEFRKAEWASALAALRDVTARCDAALASQRAFTRRKDGGLIELNQTRKETL